MASMRVDHEQCSMHLFHSFFHEPHRYTTTTSVDTGTTRCMLSQLEGFQDMLYTSTCCGNCSLETSTVTSVGDSSCHNSKYGCRLRASHGLCTPASSDPVDACFPILAAVCYMRQVASALIEQAIAHAGLQAQASHELLTLTDSNVLMHACL